MMSARYLLTNYNYLQRKLPYVDEQAVKYRLMAGPGTLSVAAAMDFADRFDIGYDELFDEINEIKMAERCAESWENGRKWMHYSMDVLAQWAVSHNIPLLEAA